MRPHLLGMAPEELCAHAAEHGVGLRPDEARRLLTAAFLKPGAGPAPRPVARAKLDAVLALTRTERPEIVERVTDPEDGFVKYLFRANDGAFFEAVRIPLHKPGCFSVCLSSQVGCAMRCSFCATARLGLTRNLEAAEIVGSFLAARDEAPGRVTGAVFQGQGEPLQNYEEVIRAARVLSHPCGGAVNGRSISISTVGLAPQIRRYARERHPYRLIVSLTSTVAERRARLLPVVGKQSLEELAGAVREYHERSRRRVVLAWVLMGGENHDEAEVEGLLRHFAGIPVLVNLIDVNDARDDGYRRATDHERGAFFEELQALRAPIVRRYSGGASRHAACGMLAAVRCGMEEPT
jgi:23S rRNA (adenine2503-C2)-methyltransferase